MKKTSQREDEKFESTEAEEKKFGNSKKEFQKLGVYIRLKNHLKVIDTIAAIVGNVGTIIQYFTVFYN